MKDLEKELKEQVARGDFWEDAYNVERQRYQKLNIDFSITSSTEFIKRSGYAVTDCFFLGAKMVVEDRAGLMG